MRLPFYSRKGQEVATTDSSRRSSIAEEEQEDRSMQTARFIADDASERSDVLSNSTTLDTASATSYPSYYIANDREAKKTGMYKLSGNNVFS